jgi:hypothetical protein
MHLDFATALMPKDTKARVCTWRAARPGYSLCAFSARHGLHIRNACNVWGCRRDSPLTPCRLQRDTGDGEGVKGCYGTLTFSSFIHMLALLDMWGDLRVPLMHWGLGAQHGGGGLRVVDFGAGTGRCAPAVPGAPMLAACGRAWLSGLAAGWARGSEPLPGERLSPP